MRRLWAALLKQFQGNETMTGQVGAREVALQIVREMYFLLFDLTPLPFHLGVEQDFHKTLCSVHVLAAKCTLRRLLLIS